MKNTIFKIFILLLSVLFSISCLDNEKKYDHLLVPGVSKELAVFRKANYQDVKYELFFSIPEKRTEKITGQIQIEFTISGKVPLIIDFRAGTESANMVCHINDISYPVEIKEEHLFIAAEHLTVGKNRVTLSFTSPDQSLNRRDEQLYTLLVPDRARTLFPCFDQPDMKALYTLSLELPAKWSAISNSPVESAQELSGTNRKQIVFRQTEPLSTYLFSFVAGEFEEEKYQRNEREIAIYHRETDPKKMAQCPEIASEVFDALDWLEEYTAIPYPFAKYDLIILPGFQYGGMEHTGATLYNDRRMFLNESPTLNERLGRSALIAHETAHMWFGDYVTMEWFDDVWTKEVFANYFASQIVEPLYPDVNHQLNFMLGYIPPAYSEDRTLGSNPVKQPLDNLANAGLVYGNIIYTKSPVVMEMLIQIIGKDNFRKGIQQYLQQYAYGNADWNGLIEILDQYTTTDLRMWSQTWINEKGMPDISVQWNDTPSIIQKDPFNRGLVWPQELTYTLYTQKRNSQITLTLDEREKPLPIPAEFKGNIQAILPNIDGKGYGFFRLNQQDAEYSIRELQAIEDEVLKGSLLITLYENLLHGTISPEWFTENLLKYAQQEKNTLLFSAALNYIGNCQRLHPVQSPFVENKVWDIVLTSTPEQHRLLAFRLYTSIAHTEKAIQKLYPFWSEQKSPKGCDLSENDFINLSYILALHLPGQADEIIRKQQNRITNPDRKKEYAFISPAVSPNPETRDSVFNALLIAENRRIEPWASTALAYLNHHTRQQEAIKYIRPALNKMQEVQRTGDIFFPTAWVRALLSGHQTAEAWQEVETFFNDNPEFPVMLSNKIKQQSDFLYRRNRIPE